MPRTAATEQILILARVLADGASLLALVVAALLAAREHARRRWRRSLNRALHELRRPLQLMALSPAPASAGRSMLDLARLALDDLDAEVNGSRRIRPRHAADPAMAIQAARERWCNAFERAGRNLVDEAPGSEPRHHPHEPEGFETQTREAPIDPSSLARILDNLIANALEHGEGDVRIGCRLADDGNLLIEVIDQGRPGRRTDQARSARRGHGLEIVRDLARAAGGSFAIRIGEERTVAVVTFSLRHRAGR